MMVIQAGRNGDRLAGTRPFNPSCPALRPGIHAFGLERPQVVDGRDKHGHDDVERPQVVDAIRTSQVCDLRYVGRVEPPPGERALAALALDHDAC